MAQLHTIIYIICIVFLGNFGLYNGEIGNYENNLNGNRQTVKVNKCCENDEIYFGTSCVNHKTMNESTYKPIFINEQGETNLDITPDFVIGYPDCGSLQKWAVYHNKNSSDSLRLLPTGVLRHYVVHIIPGEGDEEEIEMINGKKQIYYDHKPGKYCLEKRIEDGIISEFAWVCSPRHNFEWTETEFLMKNLVSPVTHLITIACLLTIAIIYFIMPTLNDLSGNIITTICLCLIVCEAADLIRLLTIFKGHVSLLITGGICYFSILAAFFWLNSLGFYIWKTFRSRNVFLRITDGKKYCYYALIVWSCTVVVSVLAFFAHYTLDYQEEPKIKFDEDQEEIGSLGMVIFFVPVAFTIICDIFFLSTTLRVINRMHTYGRIHHKLRHSFRMFVLLLIVMSVTWLFFLSTFSSFEGLKNCYIIINALQGPLFIYVCIINQKHVGYLIRKSCCYNACACKCCQPHSELDWGDEMTAMNTFHNT